MSTMPEIRIHKEGRPFLAIFAAVTLLFFWWGGWAGEILGFAGIILTAWCAYFFRDPTRVTPIGDGLVISPADGVVQMITETLPPKELGMKNVPLRRISIFMNVFDCHVNRSPVDGEIMLSSYRPGTFVNASLDKASEDNERRALRLLAENGQELAVVQIAGLVARRIVSWAHDGAKLKTGERFGMIRFGSRVDVYVPEGTRILAAVGQRAVAGETVIAELGADGPDREGEVR